MIMYDFPSFQSFRMNYTFLAHKHLCRLAFLAGLYIIHRVLEPNFRDSRCSIGVPAIKTI